MRASGGRSTGVARNGATGLRFGQGKAEEGDKSTGSAEPGSVWREGGQRGVLGYEGGQCGYGEEFPRRERERGKRSVTIHTLTQSSQISASLLSTYLYVKYSKPLYL